MEAEKWQKSIERWRKLSESEKQAIRWKMIPRSVAASMVFAGQPVDLAMLEEEHARVPVLHLDTTPKVDR
ncbi:hypothetical protein ACW73L_19355 [Methylolobus aquaticus]